MRGLYDYENPGKSERISKSVIRVKKGGGLYLQLKGDPTSTSMVEVFAHHHQQLG
jgi:hypothetical protein